jgi:hypothetical protein
MLSPTIFFILSLTVSFILSYTRFSNLKPLRIGLSGTHVLTSLYELLFPRVVFKVILLFNGKDGKNESVVYGLGHGRLHLKIPPPMWMNMDYW